MTSFDTGWIYKSTNNPARAEGTVNGQVLDNWNYRFAFDAHVLAQVMIQNGVRSRVWHGSAPGLSEYEYQNTGVVNGANHVAPISGYLDMPRREYAYALGWDVAFNGETVSGYNGFYRGSDGYSGPFYAGTVYLSVPAGAVPATATNLSLQKTAGTNNFTCTWTRSTDPHLTSETIRIYQDGTQIASTASVNSPSSFSGSAGHYYQFAILSTGQTGTSTAWSNEAKSTLLAPDSLSSSYDSIEQKINLQFFNPNYFACGYIVEESSNQSSWSTTATGTTAATSFTNLTDMSVPLGTAYYRVRFTSPTVTSNASFPAQQTIQAPLALTAGVRDVTYSGSQNAMMVLNWTVNTSTERPVSSIVVQEDTNGDGVFSTVGSIAASTTRHLVIVAAGSRCQRRYYATNAAGDSPPITFDECFGGIPGFSVTTAKDPSDLTELAVSPSYSSWGPSAMIADRIGVSLLGVEKLSAAGPAGAVQTFDLHNLPSGSYAVEVVRSISLEGIDLSRAVSASSVVMSTLKARAPAVSIPFDGQTEMVVSAIPNYPSLNYRTELFQIVAETPVSLGVVSGTGTFTDIYDESVGIKVDLLAHTYIVDDSEVAISGRTQSADTEYTKHVGNVPKINGEIRYPKIVTSEGAVNVVPKVL